MLKLQNFTEIIFIIHIKFILNLWLMNVVVLPISLYLFLKSNIINWAHNYNANNNVWNMLVLLSIIKIP